MIVSQISTILGFDHKISEISWMEYYSADDFYKNLNSTTAITNTRCNDTVVDAISKVFLATAINNKSPILVFTDVPADDGADYLTIVFYNTFRKLPVGFFPNHCKNVDFSDLHLLHGRSKQHMQC